MPESGTLRPAAPPAGGPLRWARLRRLAGVGIVLAGLWAPGAWAAPPDTDGDLVHDGCDNCRLDANRSQLDTDGDAWGNACDCDFDGDGVCGIGDFNLFLPDFQSGVDSGLGTDMDGDGPVSIGDFNLFLPGFAAGVPGPGASAAAVVDGSCDPAVDGSCTDPYRPGACFDARWPAAPLLDQGSAAGCAPRSCAFLEKALEGQPPEVFAGVCPGGVGGAVVAGFDWNNPAEWIAQQIFLNHPLGNPLGLAPPQCPNAAFGSADAASPRPCDARDLCEGRCGYGDADCRASFVLSLRSTCQALVGSEKDWCGTLCSGFAFAYLDAEFGPAASLLDPVFDAGRFTGPASPGELGGAAGSEEALCSCCPSAAFLPASGEPPVCGDGRCDAPLESCHVGSCPQDCGACPLGQACVADADCALGGCVSGLCRRLPFGGRCDVDGDCASADCALPTGVCQPGTCGDGDCGATEWCGLCPADCGACTLYQDCGTPGSGNCGPGLTCHGFTGHATPGSAICLPTCAADGDCAANEVCDQDACVPVGSLVDGSSCSDSEACASGLCFLDLLPPFSASTLCADTCSSDAGCPSGSLCDFGACIPEGSKATGATCVRNAVCASGACNFGFCVNPLPAGLPCTTDSACRSGNCAGLCIEVCGDGFCDGTEVCAGPGQDAEPGVFPGTTSCHTDCGRCPGGSWCDEDADCQSPLFCDAATLGLCVAPLPDGSVCVADIQCASGDCNTGFCGGIPNGGPCTSSGQCASGICNLGFCSAGGLGVGSACTTSLACDTGLVCRTGICQPPLLPNGSPCTTGSQCQSGVCNLAQCVAPASVSVGGACTTSSACGSGKCLAGVCVCQQSSHCPGSALCVSNVCVSCQGSGQVCTSGSQCCSGSCSFFTCS